MGANRIDLERKEEGKVSRGRWEDQVWGDVDKRDQKSGEGERNVA